MADSVVVEIRTAVKRICVKMFTRSNDRQWTSFDMAVAAGLPPSSLMPFIMINMYRYHLPMAIVHKSFAEQVCILRGTKTPDALAEQEARPTMDLVREFEALMEPIYDDAESSRRIAAHPFIVFWRQVDAFCRQNGITGAAVPKDYGNRAISCAAGPNVGLLYDRFPGEQIEIYSNLIGIK